MGLLIPLALGPRRNGPILPVRFLMTAERAHVLAPGNADRYPSGHANNRRFEHTEHQCHSRVRPRRCSTPWVALVDYASASLNSCAAHLSLLKIGAVVIACGAAGSISSACKSGAEQLRRRLPSKFFMI